MWFGLSLVAILFWSLTDLFSKAGSKREDKYSHWKMAMLVGFVMGIHALIMILLGEEFRLRDMVTYFPASAMYILSMVIGYVGLRYLYLSLSSPICNSSGAVAAILCFFLLGERLAVWQYVGVALIIISILALSITEKVYEKPGSGAWPEQRRRTENIRIAFWQSCCLFYTASLMRSVHMQTACCL